MPRLVSFTNDNGHIETNIMVATHADSMIAEAALKGVTGFDRQIAWDAMFKDATVPPKDDKNTSYYDREEVGSQHHNCKNALISSLECRLRSPCRPVIILRD